MSNITFIAEPPPLPSFSLEPTPSLIKSVPDLYLTLALPIVAYWGWGMIFCCFDVFHLFEQYRIHTPAEIKKRNLVPILDIVLCVVIQQTWQIALGIWLYSGPDLSGRDKYDIAIRATRVRLAQRCVPAVFGVLGLDPQMAAWRLAPLFSTFAGFLNGGGLYLDFTSETVELGVIRPAFLAWEIFFAKVIYYILVPAWQFCVAIFVGDSWQYFLHRASHEIGWIYREKCLHPTFLIPFNTSSRKPSFNPPSSLLPLSFWGILCQSSGSLCLGCWRNRIGLVAVWTQRQTDYVVYYSLGHENVRRSLWVQSPL